MTESTLFWFRTLFQLQIYKASGDRFQQLFEEIMQYHNPDFQPIEPWGNWGDGGNDGWLPPEKRYFQVCGPKAGSSVSVAEVAKKSIADFAKLKAKWPTVESYHFVLNDRYEGIPAPISQGLADMQAREGLLEASAWGAGRLEYIFMQLAPDQKEMIIGGIPSAMPEFIDPSAVGELLRSLADRDISMQNFLSETAPDFDEKIRFNGLSPQVKRFMSYFFYQKSTVDAFLEAQGVYLAQAIAGELRSLYKQSQQMIPDTADNAADLRYAWLVDALVPMQARTHPHSKKAYREVAQVVLAKYFEACDIYEHPDSTAPT